MIKHTSNHISGSLLMSPPTCELLPSAEQTEISTTVSPKFRGTGCELSSPFTVTFLFLSGTLGSRVTALQ